MSKRLIPVLSLLAAIVLLLMLIFTTPTDVGPFGVLVFFVAIYAVMFGVATLVVGIFMRIFGKKMGKKGYLYSAVFAFGPIMLLLAQSLGSISLVTVGLMLAFVFLACFLIGKKTQA